MRPRRGAAAIEFALWMPLMLVMFAGIIDLSMYMQATHAVVRAAREAARVTASTSLSQLTVTSPVSAVDTQLTALCQAHGLVVMSDSGNACTGACTVTCSWQTDASAATASLSADPEIVVVRVSRPYASSFNLLPFLSGANTAATFTMITMIQDSAVVP